MELKYLLGILMVYSMTASSETHSIYRIDLKAYNKNIYDINGNLVNGNSGNNNGESGGESGGEGGGEGENNPPHPECGSANGETYANGNPPTSPNLCNIGTPTEVSGYGEKYYWMCETPIPDQETLTSQCEANRVIQTTDYSSCNEYMLDSGQTQSGVYLFTINGQQLNVYCDMQQHGGGWMLITVQKEMFPVGWGQGVHPSYNPLVDSFSFNEGQLPAARYQVAFGTNIGEPFTMFGDFVYTTGNIPKTNFTSRVPVRQYHIHRESNSIYYQFNPDSVSYGDGGEYNNTLTIDRTSQLGRNWAFSPNAITESERGYYINGSNVSANNDSNSWTIWVR